MDHQRWNRIGEILADALELPPAEREDFLNERCGSDESLRAEVEELLLASEEDGLLPADPEPEPPDLVGTTIGHYRVEALIGVGGMGRVYRGVDTVLGRDVALKFLSGGDDDLDVSARFRREARILASLNHPNIGAIYGFERWEGRLVLVLEYVEGPTLEERLEEGRLGVREAVAIATDVADALEAAHERGIVHRDLKPGNVVLARDGRAKVLDFGIAKPTGEGRGPGGSEGAPAGRTAVTAAGRVLGTPGYMSPEQIRGRALDTRVDLWAFGVLLFEMLAGVGPFEGEDEAQRMARVLDQPPNWSALPGDVPASLRSLIGRCLIKYPALRMSSIAEAGPFLEDAGRRGRSGPWDRTRRWLAEHRTGVAAVGLALAAVVTGILVGERFFAAPFDGSPRVLVLPFEYLGEPGDEYLAEGVSEEIRGRLAGLATFTVLGRQTAVYVSRRGMAPEEIGSELNADFILDGTVRVQRRPGGPDRMRVRAALTSVRSLSEVWSETYDGSAEDVFAVQADVAARVAEAVGIRAPAGRFPGGEEGEPDLRAYDYYLRGNEYARRSELEGPMRAALAMYEESTRLDPDFAPAWGALSIMRSRLRWRGYERSAENLELARRAARRALALDPGEARAHLALGYVHYYGSRAYEPALESFTRAAALAPGDPETHFAVGVVARRKGDWDRAVDALVRALATDPRHAEVAIILGETYLALGRYDEAREKFDRAIAIAPDRPGGYLFRSWLRLASEDDPGPAVEAVTAGWERAGEERVFGLLGRYLSQIDWWLTRVLARDPRYRRIFGEIDLLALSVDSATHYLHRAEFFRASNDRERARLHFDSARAVLEARVELHRGLDGTDPTVLQRSQQAARLAHLGLAYAGLGRKAESLAAAEEGVAHIPSGHDALHGSEARIQLGLILALLGERERAVDHLSAALAEPSSFRVEMLRHDPDLSSLLEDPRLRALAVRGLP